MCISWTGAPGFHKCIRCRLVSRPLSSIQRCEELLQLWRQLTLARDFFSGARVVQFQFGGVQKIAIERKFAGRLCRLAALRRRLEGDARRAVERVPYDRMSERLHVYANLVSSTGIDFDVDERKLAETGFQPARDVIVGDRLASTWMAGGHSGAVDAVTADALCD